MNKLTSAEYVAKRGVACPNCGSHDLRGDSFDTGDGGVFQRVDCMACEATWTDDYVMVGYSELEVPEASEG